MRAGSEGVVLPFGPAAGAIVIHAPITGRPDHEIGPVPTISFSDPVPRAPLWEEYVTRTVAFIAFAYGVYWLTWRWTSTLNLSSWGAGVFSVALVLAETYGLSVTAIMIFTTWKLSHRTPPPAPRGLNVDVFITNFDEPLEILRRTAIGARAINYPHRTYMLDDGKRDEVMDMAKDLGIGYVRRVGNERAKAGNLNFAMSVTDDEFVLQLDADHVPLPHMLDRLLGYFEDEKVAFVQSPQDFYNTDSFSHVVNDTGRRVWEENRIFFSLIQPGKDHWNSSFFCGSCGVLRKSALDSIGGFQFATIIEDMDTSLVLHAHGWKSVFHSETLAYGLAPTTAHSYHVQRLRWGQGSMQMLRKRRPLFNRNLTVAQRIQYWSSTSTYLDGYQKFVFYLAPIIYLTTGALPVQVTGMDLLVRLVPYFILSLLSYELLSRGTGWILIAERYNMAKFFTYMLVVPAFFSSKPRKFNVTPKGKADAVPFFTYAPQLILAVLSFASIIWATFAYHYGWINYNSQGWGGLSFWLNGFWISWNLYFSLWVVNQCLQQRQQRADHRFVDTFPIQVRLVADKIVGNARLALTRDLNPTGLSFRAPYRVEAGSEVEIPLQLAQGTITIRGEVRHVEELQTPHGTVFQHGVAFKDLPLQARDAIELHATQHAVPMWRMQYRQSISFLSRATEVFGNTRRERRQVIQLPAMVSVGDGAAGAVEGVGLLDEMSAGGARFLMEQPLQPGTQLRYTVPGTSISGAGTVVFNRILESPLVARYAVGVARTDRAVRSWSPWLKRPYTLMTELPQYLFTVGSKLGLELRQTVGSTPPAGRGRRAIVPRSPVAMEPPSFAALGPPAMAAASFTTSHVRLATSSPGPGGKMERESKDFRDAEAVAPLGRDFTRGIGDHVGASLATADPFEKQALSVDKMRAAFGDSRREILELRQALLSLDARSSDFYEVTERLANVFMNYCRFAGEMWSATAVPETVANGGRRPEVR